MNTAPRPLPIVKPGVLTADDELQALARVSFTRGLTREEQARSDALSWKPDAGMETVRAIRARHEDIYALLPQPLRDRLEGVNLPNHRQVSYESLRQAAIEAGRAVPEPTAAALAEVDRMAAEVKETAADKYADLDDRHRLAFQTAVRAEGLGPVAVKEWADWLAERLVANEYAARRARAQSWLGRSVGVDTRRPPMLVTELELALGGASIDERLPIPQR